MAFQKGVGVGFPKHLPQLRLQFVYEYWFAGQLFLSSVASNPPVRLVVVLFAPFVPNLILPIIISPNQEDPCVIRRCRSQRCFLTVDTVSYSR